MLTKVLHGENQPPPFFVFLTWYEGDVILNLWQKVNFHITNIAIWLNCETSCPIYLPPTSRTHLGNPVLCTPDIKVLVNECITEIFYTYIYKLPVNAIVRLPILEVEIARTRKRFLAPSADKQTCNYDTRVLKPPSLPISSKFKAIEPYQHEMVSHIYIYYLKFFHNLQDRLRSWKKRETLSIKFIIVLFILLRFILRKLPPLI